MFNPPNDHIKISTSDGGLFEPKNQMKKIYNLMIKNTQKFRNLISHNINLADINNGIEYVKR